MIGIDPGPERSAMLIYEPGKQRITALRIDANDAIRYWLGEMMPPDTCAIEMVASYGMPVGRDVFETAFWVGRFYDTALRAGLTAERVYRTDVKMHLCRSMRAKDSNIRAALIDRFPKSGKDGKKRPSARGTLSHPGPLFGIHDDLWAALAVAVTYTDLKDAKKNLGLRWP